MSTTTHRMGAGRCQGATRGFTLIELLVVIAIIALLIGVLLPALGRARQTARTTLCTSNIRQITISLVQYAMDNRGSFPPSAAGSTPAFPGGAYWYDESRLGKYLPQIVDIDAPSGGADKTVAGGVMVCPSHIRGARSYGMNRWAAPRLVGGVVKPIDVPGGDRTFTAETDFGSQMLLVGEMWASRPIVYAPGTRLAGERFFVTEDSFGSFGRPGQRFGGGVGINDGSINPGSDDARPPEMGPGDAEPTSYMSYSRHPQRNRDHLRPNGNTIFGYVDTSVRQRRASDLFDATTGRSLFDTLWSPKDFQIDRAPGP